jgi:hypothetical protein
MTDRNIESMKDYRIIERMKNAVKGYYREIEKAALQMEQNRRMYQPDVAQEENRRLQSFLDRKKADAIADIDRAKEEGLLVAQVWGRLKNEDVTGDADFLKMNIAPIQFNELVEKYRDNGTMSALLYEYGDRKNTERKQYVFNLEPIVTREKKERAFESFAAGAKTIIEQVAQRGASPLMQTAVDTYGTENGGGAYLFSYLD